MTAKLFQGLNSKFNLATLAGSSGEQAKGEVLASACIALPLTNKTIAGDVRTTLPQYFLL